LREFGVGPYRSNWHSAGLSKKEARPGFAPVRREAEIVNEVMTALVEYREGGKLKRAPRIELMIKCYGAKALKGDVAAAEALLKIRENFEGHRAIEPIDIQLPKSCMAAA
jgi:hypothetical protein